MLPVSTPASPTPRSSAPTGSPRPLLCVTLALSPPPSLPKNLFQCFPNTCLRRLLTLPCVPPVPSPLISHLLCAHLEDRPQCHPLCHHPLSSSGVGHLQLGSRRFPHYFRPGIIPCPVCYPLRSFPRDLYKKSVCVPSDFLSVAVESAQLS